MIYSWLLLTVLNYIPEDGRKDRNICEVSVAWLRTDGVVLFHMKEKMSSWILR